MQNRSTQEHTNCPKMHSRGNSPSFRICGVLAWIVVSVCGLGAAQSQKSPAKPPPKPKVTVTVKPPVKPVEKPLDETDALFNSKTVLTISIELSKESLDSLRRDNRKYVPATLKEGGKVYEKVAIHLRGAAGSSRGIDDKPGLTLNMDKFVDGQRFHGMDKWHLTNSVQDPSYANELICGELFRDAGVPAARFAHAIIEINGRKRGLYCIKEGYDAQFLKRHFGNSKGNFYDGGFLRDIDQSLDWSSGKKDVPEYSDLKALVAACNENDSKTRFDKISEVLDVERFISYLAMETITDDWDGYARARNNYRIYHDPKRNKIIFIPSGMDQMFRDPNSSIMPGYSGLVARRVIETPEGKKRYLTRLREIMQTVYKPEVRIKRLEELSTRLKTAMTPVDQGAANNVTNDIHRFQEAIRQRQKSIEEQIKRLPAN